MLDHLKLTKHRAFYKNRMHYGSYTRAGFIDAQGELLAVNKKAVSVALGVEDRKGKTIYTGDVLKDYKNRVGIVRFLSKGGVFVLTLEGVVNVVLSAPMAKRCQLIGNVFQDKEYHSIIKEIKENVQNNSK